MNFLLCSVGRRGELLKNIKNTLGENGYLVATDNSKYAPALYFADKQYIVPKITDDKYISILVDICKTEKINAIATFIDPEIEILSKNRKVFEDMGITVLVPYLSTAAICFDKYNFYMHMKKNNIRTVKTYSTLEDFDKALKNAEIQFPVFVKPRNGSGSVGARKIADYDTLKIAVENDSSLIIQEFMNGVDMDADIYVDTINKKVVSAFSKKKLSTTIGGANKTISFKDEKLFDFIEQIASVLELYGPNDIDFFFKDGEYYVSEINPRFGGAYLHAYGAGVDFIELIKNNVEKKENEQIIGNYDEGIAMMMYDSVVIKKFDETI